MDQNIARLEFTQEWDEFVADTVEMNGWCGLGVVVLPGNLRVEVFFYDPVRLASDLESNLKSGHACVAEPNMIVVPTVTRECMEAAVNELYEQGYFDRVLNPAG